MSQPIAADAVVKGARVSITADILPLAGAVMLSAIFLISGLGKLAAPSQTIGYMASVGLPLATLGYVIAVVVEVGGGLALIVGYRARLAALALAVFSLAAAVAFHSNLADQNQLVHFLKNVAMAGGLLQIVAYGRGRLSLDAARGR